MKPNEPGWRVALYPEAGEAGGSFHATQPYREPPTPGAPAADPEASQAAALRRARGKIRRYAAANRLNRLGTLTYRGDGCHNPRQLRADIAQFFRNLRRNLGGDPFPYLWVPELHKTGHGYHIHFAVARYIPRSHIDTAWGHGFIHIRLIGDLPVGSTTREEARVGARYLSKYLGKDLGSGGLNRYDVAQGFQPDQTPLYGDSEPDIITQATHHIGQPPSIIWRSVNEPGWNGPPALWLSWA